MLTARSGCTPAPTALTTLTQTFTLRLQNRGPGDEADSTPLCIRDTYPHLCPSQTPVKSKGPNTVSV